MNFKNKDFPIIVCLELESGYVAPLAWSDCEISKKSLNRKTAKFMKDKDVVGVTTMPSTRLYKDQHEMKTELPKF